MDIDSDHPEELLKMVMNAIRARILAIAEEKRVTATVTVLEK